MWTEKGRWATPGRFPGLPCLLDFVSCSGDSAAGPSITGRKYRELKGANARKPLSTAPGPGRAGKHLAPYFIITCVDAGVESLRLRPLT